MKTTTVDYPEQVKQKMREEAIIQLMEMRSKNQKYLKRLRNSKKNDQKKT